MPVFFFLLLVFVVWFYILKLLCNVILGYIQVIGNASGESLYQLCFYWKRSVGTWENLYDKSILPSCTLGSGNRCPFLFENTPSLLVLTCQKPQIDSCLWHWFGDFTRSSCGQVFLHLTCEWALRGSLFFFFFFKSM